MTEETGEQKQETAGEKIGEGTGETGETGEKGDAEARARRMGWVPESEWQGDPPKAGFASAEAFIERGESELPILRERNRKLDKELAETSQRIAELGTTLAEFKEHSAKVDERAVKRAKEELKAAQRKAVEDGDTDAFDTAAKGIEDLDKDAPKPEDRSVKAQAKSPDDDPVFKKWAGQNPWYGDDVVRTVFANSAAPIIAEKGYTGTAFYAEIEREVRAEYPERFENPNRKRASNVEGGGRSTPRPKKNGRDYGNLPAEAKAQCDKFVKTMVKGANGKMEPLLTREQFVEDYDWSEA